MSAATYLVKVSTDYAIAGMDEDRWIVITPEDEIDVLEWQPVSRQVAEELIDDGWGTGSERMSDVHDDLLEIQASPLNQAALVRELPRAA